MFSFDDLKGKNGISIQSLCDFLVEQCIIAGCPAIILISTPPETGVSRCAIFTTVKGTNLPNALEAVAREMRIGAEESKVEEPS